MAAENFGIVITNTLDFEYAFSNAPALNIIGISAAADPFGSGTEFSGLINLGTNAVSIGLGGSNNLVVFSGRVIGSGSLNIYGNSILALEGQSSYTGSTTISSGTLELAATSFDSTNLVLAGGTLMVVGDLYFTFTGNGTTLCVATNSTIGFDGVGEDLVFADSSGITWNGILNLTNYLTGYNYLQFYHAGYTNNSSALTKAQLAKIEFDGMGLGSAQLDQQGYVVSLGQILSPKISGTNFIFNLATVSNQIYEIDSTTNLASASWTNFTVFFGDGGTDEIVVPIPPGSSHQFFRVNSTANQ